ncbi:hypothetical protein [Streptomyces alkaliterrae]|uniref:Uncharacterized protein n=1 Tax=Streptomyces alkaliterrae TaxID=2213162 RepID=A0A5P0YZS2_9ACTN|nr:hypothetical protein [Streptomyces alkaliterrae]MBB1261959.1 hypothetical protein [Streptomyces alkaliterrae]MQS05322.1 hypothetical protein [Streptomyces alkaliterrae]
MRKKELAGLIRDVEELRRAVNGIVGAFEQSVATASEATRETVRDAGHRAAESVRKDIKGLRDDVRSARDSAATATEVQGLHEDVRELRALLQALRPHLAEPPSPRGDSPAHALPSEQPPHPDVKENHSVSQNEEIGPSGPEATPLVPPSQNASVETGSDGDTSAALASQLRGVLAELRGTATSDETRTLREEVGELRREMQALRGDGLRGEAGRGDGVLEDEGSAENKAHDELLLAAARVSSATLICHRDTWEFVVAQAAPHPHFRCPQAVADDEAGRIRTALSGRSLIAVLISLWHTRQHRPDPADWALAHSFYDRIADGLAALGPDGEPVTIVLDDRADGIDLSQGPPEG